MSEKRYSVAKYFDDHLSGYKYKNLSLEDATRMCEIANNMLDIHPLGRPPNTVYRVREVIYLVGVRKVEVENDE